MSITKEAARFNIRPTISRIKGNKAVRGAAEIAAHSALGATISSEMDAVNRGEGAVQGFLSGDGFFDSLLNAAKKSGLGKFIQGDEVSRRAFAAGATSGGLGGSAGLGLKKIMPAHKDKINVGNTVLNAGIAGYLDPALAHKTRIDNLTVENDRQANLIESYKAQSDEVNNTTNNVLKSIGLGIGAAGLGLGGYTLYKYLKNKEEDRNTPPRVKVRLKGQSSDIYDDATVELPLPNLRLSKSLSEGVNRSMRRVIRENNKFGGRKKDPITGELITYEEYINKYGDPEQRKRDLVVNNNYEN